MTVLKIRAVKVSLTEYSDGHELSDKDLEVLPGPDMDFGSMLFGPKSSQSRPTAMCVKLKNRSTIKWTIDVSQCRLLGVQRKTDGLVLMENVAVREASVLSGPAPETKITRFVIEAKHEQGMGFSFNMKPFDCCVLILPAVSDDGQQVVYHLLYSEKHDRISRRLVDIFIASDEL
ncbi:MAG: hypothetical protein HUU46_23790 [Candidatus Hydrogenedentes bacterium]|nr:hypothetical protein [Candidatus Hydrogenedentota bacterium]